MIRFSLFRNSANQIRSREKSYAERYLGRYKETSKFDYGCKELGLKENSLEALEKFSKEWNKDPDKKLNFRRFPKPDVKIKDGWVSFPSLLDKKDTAYFRYVRQPKWRSGHRVLIVMLKHWNADTHKYSKGINFIRRTMLPISTGLMLPSYQDLNPAKDKKRQNQTLGANVGITIKRTWQDVLDLQCFGNFLKEEEGLEEVGLFPYSIGSLRGYLAKLFAPDIFNYGVLHYIADDYTEALMEGVATKPEADVLRDNIDAEKLRKIWSVISPGNYEDHMEKLGKNFRLVQAKHDLVFGPQNCRRFSKKVRKHSPDTEIYEGNFGHITMAEVEKATSLMIRDLNFIYNHCSLKYF